MLLHALRVLQRNAPIRFELGAATVDPMTPEYKPEPLVAYLKALGVAPAPANHRTKQQLGVRQAFLI